MSDFVVTVRPRTDFNSSDSSNSDLAGKDRTARVSVAMKCNGSSPQNPVAMTCETAPVQSPVAMNSVAESIRSSVAMNSIG